MTNTTQTDLLDGVEPIGEIYQDLDTLQPAFRFLSVFKYTSSVGVNPMVTFYDRETVESLYEARIDANRKQVLLEAELYLINLSSRYIPAALELRRMALEPTVVDKGEG